MKRERSVATWPQFGGYPCPGVNAELEQCGNEPCPSVDCEWTEWEGWSPCSKSCGDGIRERQRNVSREALNGGDSCQGAAAAFEECNDGPCLFALTPEKLQTEVDNLRTELKNLAYDVYRTSDWNTNGIITYQGTG